MVSPEYAVYYAIINTIPPGRVATYGDVAKCAGWPRNARRVGYALHALRDDTVPWWRVVNAKGEIGRRESSAMAEQRRRLESEGVVFDSCGRIPVAEYGWASLDVTQ